MMQKKRKRKMGFIILAVVLVLAIGVAAFFGVVNHQINQIPAMSFGEMMAYTTKGKEGARITVGIINGDDVSFTVYGADGVVLPAAEYTYEIGSITKTFTTSLLCRAISEGKMNLDDSIDEYLNLPQKDHYPTLAQLVTHTSGYKGHYFEWQMAANFLQGQGNSFYGITEEQLQDTLAQKNIQNKEYGFQYSNFGISVVGSVLAEVYGQSYGQLMADYIANDLGLQNTRISDGTGDLNGYWGWKADDAYLPAGAILSTVSDMMQYLRLHMEDTPGYLAAAHTPVAVVDGNTSQNEKMGICIDAVGMGWMLDEEDGFVWHNGGTSNFNSYAGFNKQAGVGVVILSNLAPGFRIPATVMGVRLLKDLMAGNS